MLNEKNERELVYVVEVREVLPMNADRLEEVKINGWSVVCGKGEFKKGDIGVYFEIDSQLPEISPFNEMKFLKDKEFRIKTQKIRGVYSQGLLLPISSIISLIHSPQYKDENGEVHLQIGDYLTEELGVIHYVPTYNQEKRNNLKINTNNKQYKKFFPSWVKKTDEERIQNVPQLLEINVKWDVTEKIDGTSTTFTVHKVKGILNRIYHFIKYGFNIEAQYDFYVCSRNVCFDPELSNKYTKNVYLKMAEKYNMKEILIKIAHEYNYDWFTIQGETFGEGIQKREYGITGDDSPQFRAFNVINPIEGRIGSRIGEKLLSNYDIPWVPILDTVELKGKTVEEVVLMSDGNSKLDNKAREGLVFRSEDGRHSFKALSNKYLISKFTK